MIRCVRLWSGPDGNSHFEEGVVGLEPGPRSDMLSNKFPIRRRRVDITDRSGKRSKSSSGNPYRV
jgi:hypothetical protein